MAFLINYFVFSDCSVLFIKKKEQKVHPDPKMFYEKIEFFYDTNKITVD